MAVNYNDKRFTQVNNEKNVALRENEQIYDNMINSSDKYYQAQIDASKNWADTQTKLQQEQTDFAIEQIGQQKEQTRQDYLKEQTGAYVDWQKQSNQYGANAEQRASQGLAETGYAESSQVSMYNTYQNRVATARETYSRAVLNYDNAIKDARLQNNSKLAEIAYNSLQQQLELSLQGFQYKNQLVLQKAQAKRDIDNTYYSRYQDVLAQINTENALMEQQRQYNETLKEQQRQHNETLKEQKRQHNETLAFQKEQFNWQKKNSSVSSGGKSRGRSSKKSSSSNKSSIAKNSTQNSGNAQIKKGNSEPTVDMNSVLKLGYGPINEQELDRLVRAGKVKEYVEDGKLKFKRTTPRTPTSNFNSLKNASKKKL